MLNYVFFQKLIGCLLGVHSFDRILKNEIRFSFERLFYLCPSDSALFRQTAVTQYITLNSASGLATEHFLSSVYQKSGIYHTKSRKLLIKA